MRTGIVDDRTRKATGARAGSGILPIQVTEAVRKYLRMNSTQKSLGRARHAIVDCNDYGYEEILKKIVREALATIRRSIPDCQIVSFHFSSLALRRWLRITPENVWQATQYTGSEVDLFTKIYDWDTRCGHIMTDPEMPDALYACFGGKSDAATVPTKKSSRCHRLLVKRATWKRARELVKSKAFPVLVEHDLDKCREIETVLPRLAAAPVHTREKKTAQKKFAKSLWEIGKLATKLWPKNQAPSVVEAARSFLLSFYYTIGRYDDEKFEQIVTTTVGPLHSPADENGHEKNGALAIVFETKTPANIRIESDDIDRATEELTRAIVELEHQALFDRVHDGVVTIGEENIIRKACEIDVAEEVIRTDRPSFPCERLWELSQPLFRVIAELLVERRHPGREGDTNEEKREREARLEDLRDVIRKSSYKKLRSLLTRELDGTLDATIDELFVDFKIVGASHVYCQLLRDLAAAAATDDLSESRIIFLDSEPGCGKENLPKLIHLFSRRGHLDVYLRDNLLKEARDRFEDFSTDSGDQILAPLVVNVGKTKDGFNPRKVQAIARTVLTGKKRLKPYKEARLFNYFTVNMATLLDKGRFTEVLFGKYEERNVVKTRRASVASRSASTRNKDKQRSLARAGRCLLAHALTGTVFLDEFNTLPAHREANSFLRLLDKPFEMDVPDRPSGPLRGVKMLAVFASNKSREELIEAGFNEAVVYRVTKTRIRIPPLREHPVDIAVLVNAQVRKCNKRQVENGEHDAQIHRIELPAMRLLCELRWPDNYRGVQGLVDDVLGIRTRRKIRHDTLTFEEILQGLRRREAFQADVTQGKTESIERAAK